MTTDETVPSATIVPEATLMYAEAGESASVLERQFGANDVLMRALAERLRAHPPSFVITCARGSSDHAATFAKYAFETKLGLGQIAEEAPKSARDTQERSS